MPDSLSLPDLLSFVTSPTFVITVSAVATIGIGCWSYVYMPMQIRRAYRQSLLALARTAETKDSEAAGHGERVAQYVSAIARQMGVFRGQISRMEYAAFLQDIGNVRVPHAILNKKDKLTDKEFKILKTHTVTGAEIVEQVNFLRDIAPMIRHHHENWDGTGYPDGLKGRGIPLGSRILAVATAYDSMVSNRPYRSRLDEDRAIEQVRAGSGTLYDPDVVEAFLKVLQKYHRAERRSS